MSDYSKLSDFEINFRVAEALNKFEYVSDHNAEGGSAVLCDSLRDCDTYDYCNDPSDAWPIIFQNKIGMSWLRCQKLWLVDSGDIYIRERKNPLRAAMIVFLMMNEEEE